MELREKSGRSGELGFTLIEVTLSILILAGSLTTLVGLQSAVIRRTARDRQSQLAMLAARRVLAGVELSDFSVDLVDEEGTADELIVKFGKAELVEGERELLRSLDMTLTIEDQTIPNLDQLSFRRLELEVSWGQGSTDVLKVMYILPGEER